MTAWALNAASLLGSARSSTLSAVRIAASGLRSSCERTAKKVSLWALSSRMAASARPREVPASMAISAGGGDLSVGGERRLDIVPGGSKLLVLEGELDLVHLELVGEAARVVLGLARRAGRAPLDMLLGAMAKLRRVALRR